MKVMLRQDQGGNLLAYIPKKDLEERVLQVEEDGGEQILFLANGWRLAAKWDCVILPPLTVEARRL